MTKTKNEVLVSRSSKLYDVAYSLNAGGMTYAGVNDNSSRPGNFTPFTLFKWITFDFFKHPPYSMPEDQTHISDISWTLILDPVWIEDRLNEFYKVGKIKSITVLKRDDFGVVKSIKIEGTAGNVEINGERDVNKFLSAGTMRSNLFYIRTVMKGKFPDFFIVKGIGTGNFKGICIYGANYLAKNMGYRYKDILKHYFPDAEVKEKWEK
jgi:SpoIID/LytB domain protein